MTNASYPLDTTGTMSSNLITNERHTLTEVLTSTYRIIVPEFAPFYLDNLSLTYVSGDGSRSTMVSGTDYIVTLPYIAASKSIGKPVYGAIILDEQYVNGYFEVSYQTIGDQWCSDKMSVMDYVLESSKHIRLISFDEASNVRKVFPVVNFDYNNDTTNGQDTIIDGLNALAVAILNRPTSSSNPRLDLTKHIARHDNPHLVTAAQVGLDKVINLPLANDQEVIDLVSINKYFTIRQFSQYMTTFR
jgi:hypothetical protein